MDIKDQLATLFRDAIREKIPEASDIEISFERPRDPSHGDLATNVAMQIARKLKRKPRDVAELLRGIADPQIESLEIAGPGFINIRLKAGAKTDVIPQVLAAGAAYGRNRADQPEKIQVEFVSANPTGPLHVGHGRQAALGDAIASLLTATGWKATREFYYNDAGAQIMNLALSVQARARELRGQPIEFPESGYHGEYIREIA